MKIKYFKRTVDAELVHIFTDTPKHPIPLPGETVIIDRIRYTVILRVFFPDEGKLEIVVEILE